MTSNNPPEHPRRPVEIVPLPAPNSRSGGFNRTRGAWREPLVETSVHEVNPGARRPDPAERVWVISPPTDRPQGPAPAPSSPQNRLHALLLRERTALMAQIDSSTGTDTLDRPTRAELEVAPFPLPTVPLRDTRPKRSPKARRADASGRPLAADVAAAIARATGHEPPPPPAPNLSLVRFSTARERLVIVPLDELTRTADDDTIEVEAATAAAIDATPIDATPEAMPGLAHMIDLRERRRLRNRKPLAYMCPTCDRKGIVDLIDNVTGVVSATCPRCLEMWTTEIHPDHTTVDPH